MPTTQVNIFRASLRVASAGKFISCDKDVGLAKGYKDRGKTNDKIVANAKRDVELLRNHIDADALEKAESMIDQGLFRLGFQRKIAKGILS